MNKTMIIEKIRELMNIAELEGKESVRQYLQVIAGAIDEHLQDKASDV